MPSLSPRQSPASRPANLPVIQHPKSRLGDYNTLNVIGLSTSDGNPRPMSVNSGWSRVDLLPALRLRPESCPLHKHNRMLTWPPVHEVKAGQQTAKIPKQTMISGIPRCKYSSEELYELVKESLTTGFHGVKQLFKANDPQGSGVISRAGLCRILYHLVGYLTTKQVHKLLERLGFESKNLISFDEFLSVFQKSETVRKEWMSPCKRKEVYAQQRKRDQPEENLRDRTLGNHYEDGDYVLATYANALLKDKCKRSDFNLKDHLAPSCFDKSAVILPPQLQECLASIGVLLDDYEMQKLWEKYDVENTGILTSVSFFNKLGLDAKGKIKTKQSLVSTVSSYAIDHQSIPLQNNIGKHNGNQNHHKSPKNGLSKSVFNSQWYPYNDIMSFIFSKVEENFLAMMTSCKNLADGNGSITFENLQTVLRKHNIPVALTELDKLVEKCRAKRGTGNASYKDFLYMFMTRSEHGIAHKVMLNTNHRFNIVTGPARGNLSAEDTEAKLVEVLHSCFLRLLAAFRQADVANIQVVNKRLFQRTIEQVFNISLAEDDLKSILLQFSLEEDGLVPYPEFLGLFNKKRPQSISTHSTAQSGHKRKSSPRQSPKQQEDRHVNSPEVKFEAKYQSKKMETRYRSVTELNYQIQEAIHKSSICLEAFQRLDTKSTGKMSRTQMYCWLQKLGVQLHPTELQHLWTSMNLSKDGVVDYAEVYAYFMSVKKETEDKQHFIGQIKIPWIVKNWSYIKQTLRELDPQGSTCVPISDFHSLSHDLKLNLSNVELDELSDRFDINHNGLFHYLDFLQLFVGQPSVQKHSVTKYNKYTYTIPRKDNEAHITVASAMLTLRKKLLQNWKSLRRAFRKADLNNDGFLSIVEFKSILTGSMQIHIDDEDLYHVLSEFDENMDGKISYDEFISRIIE
ncbi:EF-hand calcium-binding domain-containing protein 6-like [Antedon mediterranea]|uniref:EF-hand calcium-binding domain-containing protein 6-like n=1 Tax=Antedon mediterranea TaxID=105859 RepID=UPI003AF63CEF